MKIPADGKLLRIFVGEADKFNGKPLYEEIVLLAKKDGLAGATAIKGFMGFGCKSHILVDLLLAFRRFAGSYRNSGQRGEDQPVHP